MISRSSSSSPLQQIGRKALTSTPCNKKSWFVNARLICTQYNLLDPLLLLQEPLGKDMWKRQCKAAILSYWEEELRREASLLPSLKYFKPEYMSLREVHPFWEMAENSHEVEKARTICTMLSGRYATDYHSRHWFKTNPQGFCQLCLAARHSSDVGTDDVGVALGSLEHLLLKCPALQQTRNTCREIWCSFIADNPVLQSIFPTDSDEHGSWEPSMELLLDPTSYPAAIRSSQI